MRLENVGATGFASFVAGGITGVATTMFYPLLLEKRKFEAVVNAAIEGLSRELSLPKRPPKIELFGEYKQQLLAWNNNAIGKAAQEYQDVIDRSAPVWSEVRRVALCSAFASVSGSLLGGLIAKQIGVKYQLNQDWERRIAKIGAVWTLVITFIFTKSIRLALFNSALCTFCPAL